MKHNLRRSLILSLIALCLAILIIPLEILGWFAARKNDGVNEFEMGVVSDSEGGGVIKVTFPNGSAYGGFDMSLLPGEYSTLKITATNGSGATETFSLNITEIRVTYPTSAAGGYSYGDAKIFCPDYYGANNANYDVTSVMSEAVFKKFVSPVTNAIEYDMYYVEGNDFVSGYTPKYFTSSAKATASELISTVGTPLVPVESYIPISLAKSLATDVSGNNGSKVIADGVTVNADGTVTLENGKSLDLYLTFYFDPAKYVTADIGTAEEPNELTLRNSNPYSAQKYEISLDFVTR